MSRLIWHDKDHLQIGDVNFHVTLEQAMADAIDSTSDRFLLVKNQFLMQSAIERLPRRVDSMIEFGIYKGGSIALYEELLSPSRLVGVDIKTDRVTALDDYLEQRSATERVKLYYGTDQEDRNTLQSIALDNFTDRSLDLVIDDASHLYGPTKASLNVFLPLLRPGGMYLIEDWGWAHWLQDTMQYNQSYADQEYPLAKLILEIVMYAATFCYVIDHVLIDASRCFITRGHDDITDESFDISRAYATNLWNMEFSKPGARNDRFATTGTERRRRRLPFFKQA